MTAQPGWSGRAGQASRVRRATNAVRRRAGVGAFDDGAEKLREELERANQALEDRKLIERAKGILMKERGVNESEAYGLLRTAAMNENRRLIDVARGVVSAAGLMK